MTWPAPARTAVCLAGAGILKTRERRGTSSGTSNRCRRCYAEKQMQTRRPDAVVALHVAAKGAALSVLVRPFLSGRSWRDCRQGHRASDVHSRWIVGGDFLAGDGMNAARGAAYAGCSSKLLRSVPAYERGGGRKIGEAVCVGSFTWPRRPPVHHGGCFSCRQQADGEPHDMSPVQWDWCAKDRLVLANQAWAYSNLCGWTRNFPFACFDLGRLSRLHKKNIRYRGARAFGLSSATRRRDLVLVRSLIRFMLALSKYFSS